MTTEVKEYLQGLDEETFNFVAGVMAGRIQPDENGCTGPCNGHTGCTSNLANYFCACKNGVCVAIPET